MNTKEYIQQIRISYPIPDDALLDHLRIHGLDKTSDEIIKRNLFRRGIIEELQRNLKKDDLPLVRFLMRQEIVCEENWDMPECRSEDFETVSQMLAYTGELEDILLLWEAKHTSFDASIIIDAAYFFTKGFEEALEYVKTLQIEDSDDILRYLEDSLEDVKRWFDPWHEALRKRFTRNVN